MSWKAAAYVKDLIVCPGGKRITRSEKLLALVLADYHQVGRLTYPSVPTLAEDCLMDERHARRLLKSLVEKQVLLVEYPEKQGRGETSFYRFPAIDHAPVSAGPKEGGPCVPLSGQEKEGEKGDISRGERGTKSGRKGDISAHAYKEELKATKTNTELPRVAPAAGPLQNQDTNEIELGEIDVKDQANMIAKGVIDETGLSGLRIWEALRIQAGVELREHPGEMEKIREGMIAAWRAYEACAKADKLRFTMMGAEKFFGEGKWKSPKLWGLKSGMKGYEGGAS